jgi:hypothetical protein
MRDTERLRERALALPLAGLVLFAPPVMTILGRSVSVAGVPLSYLYVFGAWLALIVIGRRLARRLMPAVGTGADGEG